MKAATRLVNFDAGPGDPFHASATPVYQTATFEQESPLEFGAYDYTRSGNPTRAVLEAQLAFLEGAVHAFAFASGLAAITAVTRLLKAGDEILAGAELYGGTFRLFSRILPRFGISVRYVDAGDAEEFVRAVSARTRLAYVETPANPLLTICDIAGIGAGCRERGIRLCVDNTMLSPWLQNPLRLGADVVVHSATKFLGGHGDVTAGVVCTNDEEVAETIGLVQNGEGATLAPMESWLLLRGLKTLALRVERQQASARTLAERLAQHEEIGRVFYPGLAAHAGYETQRRQARGPGSVISVTTGSVERSAEIIGALRLFRNTVSFGSVTSTVSMPACMSHASVPTELRAGHAPPADLIRLSVGIEDVEDLWLDLARAIERTADGAGPKVTGATQLQGVGHVD